MSYTVLWLLLLDQLYCQVSYISRDGHLSDVYSSLPKTLNTLNIRTPKIIAKINFKMFPKISNSGLISEIECLKFQTMSFFAPKNEFFIHFTHLYYHENLL